MVKHQIFKMKDGKEKKMKNLATDLKVEYFSFLFRIMKNKQMTKVLTAVTHR